MQSRLLLVLVALLACPGKKVPNAADGLPDDDQYSQMHGFLQRVQGARDALVRGHLDQTKEHLKVLASAPTPLDMPGDAEPWMAQIRQAAYSGARAERSIEMGEAVAGVLVACGGCHLHTAGGPELVDMGPTPVDDMPRHAWADERFFEALVTPASMRWDMGAAAMLLAGEQDPRFLKGLTTQEEGPVRVLHDRVHATGLTALSSDNQRQMVAVYGAFLASCADCHAATGGGPE